MAAFLTSHKIINQGSICPLPSLPVGGVFLIFLGLRQHDGRLSLIPVISMISMIVTGF